MDLPLRALPGAQGPHAAPFRPAGPIGTVAGTLAALGTLVPAFKAISPVHAPTAARLPRLFHAWLTRAFGIQVELQGEIAPAPALIVSNHLSWLDIPVIGSRIAGSFVAKAEVAGMPLVGALADLQQTIYVDRDRRQSTGAQADAIAGRLAAGGRVILFPEGTSNDGVRILPFKTSLFAPVEGLSGTDILVQPLSLAYTELNGMPLTRNRQLDIAWIGDMELGPHAFDVMKIGRLRARILCHAPVRPAAFADRKALARHCHAAVVAGYRQLVRGQA